MAPVDDRLRVGIVGAGRIADLNCLGWIEDPRTELAAVCDLDDSLRAQRSEEWNCRPYADFDDLLADDSIDIIEILTPHHLHADQAIAALEAGKHVSLQKPPTRTLEEYDRVARAAEQASGRFRVYENFMYYPPHVEARRLVDEGGVGEVQSVRVITAGGRLGGEHGWEVPAESNLWRLDPSICGGGMTTFDHGFHCFQMGRYFVDDPIEVVHAFINIVDIGDGREIDVPALISWRYEGAPRYGTWEVIASLDLDVASDYYVSDDRIEIRGTSGIIWVNRCAGWLLDEPPLVHYRDGELRSFHRLETDWASSFRAATVAFIDAIADGTPCDLTVGSARETLAFALAAQRSAREHREVTIAEMG